MKHRFLNLESLGRAWREALLGIPPLSDLVFDLTLPTVDAGEESSSMSNKGEGEGESGSGGKSRVVWDRDMRSGDLEWGLETREVLRIVRTIATVMRMRIDRVGGRVGFAVVLGDDGR